MSTRIEGPTSVLMDAKYQSLVFLANSLDAKRGGDVTNAWVEITPASISALAVTTVMSLVSDGASVKNYPAWLVIPAAIYNDDVPVGIPNRSYENEAEETVIRTWAEWKDANHNHSEAAAGTYGAISISAGDMIVPTNGFGSDLTGSELAGLYVAGITILSKPERQSITLVGAE